MPLASQAHGLCDPWLVQTKIQSNPHTKHSHSPQTPNVYAHTHTHSLEFLRSNQLTGFRLNGPLGPKHWSHTCMHYHLLPSSYTPDAAEIKPDQYIWLWNYHKGWCASFCHIKIIIIITGSLKRQQAQILPDVNSSWRLNLNAAELCGKHQHPNRLIQRK